MPTLSVRSTKASHLQNGVPTNNGGGLNKVRVFKDAGSNTWTGIMAWDVSSILGATVTDCYGTLFNNGEFGGGTSTQNIYKILRAWNEGTKSDSAASTGEVTWNSARHNEDTWGTAGCNNTSTDRSASYEDTKTTGSAQDWAFNITNETAQEWVDGTNNGVLIQEQNTGVWNYYHSDDAAGTTDDPLLDVEYTEGGGGIAASKRIINAS